MIALYFTGVSFATNDGVKFGQWFAMIAWSMMPVVFGLAATFVNLLVSDARFLPQEQLNPLSFGNLLGHRQRRRLDRSSASLLSLDVTRSGSSCCQVIGYQVFTQRSIVRAAVVVLGPIVVIVLVGVTVAAL